MGAKGTLDSGVFLAFLFVFVTGCNMWRQEPMVEGMPKAHSCHSCSALMVVSPYLHTTAAINLVKRLEMGATFRNHYWATLGILSRGD